MVERTTESGEVMDAILRLIAGLDGYKTYAGLALLAVGILNGIPELVTFGTLLAGAGAAHKVQKLIDAVREFLPLVKPEPPKEEVTP
jgi:hypothetical protein